MTQVMNWRHGQTWYRVFGDLHNGKTPVVVLHGGPGFAHNYCIPIAELVAHTGRGAVVYDQIGCGNSTALPDAPREFWTPELFMEELVLLTQHLGIADDYAIIGQSWGGMLGMQFATTRPHGLKALVAVSCPASAQVWIDENKKLEDLLPPEMKDAIRKHEADGTTDDPAYLAASALFTQQHVCRIPEPQHLQDSRAVVAKNSIADEMFADGGALATWDIRGVLGEINVPTLIVSGQFDQATPEMMSEIHSLISGSEWDLFPDASHMTYMEEPSRFKRVVNNFLDTKLASRG
ncbi:unannotated protein [freshwater metagenome]|uniref:Unannotated protein n=1 Tax=freshwater metagenome TaxID=449393 RepID=A0A6J7XX67_9ZZZZ|nr:proline iminopeptidase-family hydrolase [Actinomycetota bacterium]